MREGVKSISIKTLPHEVSLWFYMVSNFDQTADGYLRFPAGYVLLSPHRPKYVNTRAHSTVYN